MTRVVEVFQIGTLNKYMQLPKSLERKFEEDESGSDTPGLGKAGLAKAGLIKPGSEDGSGVKSEDALMEALEYFRQQPVPVKKARNLWPFKKIPS